MQAAGAPLGKEGAEKTARSIFVGNIPYEATEEKLVELFGKVCVFRVSKFFVCRLVLSLVSDLSMTENQESQKAMGFASTITPLLLQVRSEICTTLISMAALLE